MIVGYAYVCGDILHIGHLQHLKNCKEPVKTDNYWNFLDVKRRDKLEEK